MQETTAKAYGRALAVWGQWLRHWRLTRDPRHLRAVLVYRQIAAEKLAVWQAELKLSRSAILAAREERVARTELALNTLLRQIRRDERVLRATRLTLIPEAIPWTADRVEDEPDEDLEGSMVPFSHTMRGRQAG
jgi:hypothetical protein